MDELHTDRLLLRGFRLDDRAALHAYAADPEVSRFMDWGPNDPADTTIHLNRVVAAAQKPDNQYPFAVERLADGLMIGSVELQIESRQHRRAEMGYILRRDAWGQGYATEAATALLHYGFNRLGLHRIGATCDPENAGSARILEKIGMTYEGRMTGYFHIRGEWRDRLRYAATQPRD